MKIDRVKEILSGIKNVKVAVYGDFCVDAYWFLDPRGSEVSVERKIQAMIMSLSPAFRFYSIKKFITIH